MPQKEPKQTIQQCYQNNSCTEEKESQFTVENSFTLSLKETTQRNYSPQIHAFTSSVTHWDIKTFCEAQTAHNNYPIKNNTSDRQR